MGLYALLTNRLPFDAPDIPALFKLIKRGRFSVPGFVPSDAKDLICRMLTVNPAERISIAQIKKHKWFLNGRDEQPVACKSTESTAVAFVAQSAVPAKMSDNAAPAKKPDNDQPMTVPMKSPSIARYYKSVKVLTVRPAASAVLVRKVLGDSVCHLSMSCKSFSRMSTSILLPSC